MDTSVFFGNLQVGISQLDGKVDLAFPNFWLLIFFIINDNKKKLKKLKT